MQAKAQAQNQVQAAKVQAHVARRRWHPFLSDRWVGKGKVRGLHGGRHCWNNSCSSTRLVEVYLRLSYLRYGQVTHQGP